ncbi:hypothetical protein [Jeotgalibacillus terrae]|uniref:RNA polymerase subunit sigma n=1 Tax=Jeotgalibacillus terrae TaxID=587735 RepID=A0ABW5ZMR6_9BACL|nr:hypothetical protein [Jeotgalibacillus terrae]MBM7579883.1 septal ring factor EnvC (AmiA/AmiB activator) [Jeotgalibacillus terrae]
MGHKLIGLQVAIPKTVDAGKIADQQQQQSNINQSQVAAIAEKERLRKQESVNRYGESEKTKEKREREKGERRRNQPDEELQQTGKTSAAETHPFKGRRMDFSG